MSLANRGEFAAADQVMAAPAQVQGVRGIAVSDCTDSASWTINRRTSLR